MEIYTNDCLSFFRTNSTGGTTENSFEIYDVRLLVVDNDPPVEVYFKNTLFSVNTLVISLTKESSTSPQC